MKEMLEEAKNNGFEMVGNFFRQIADKARMGVSKAGASIREHFEAFQPNIKESVSVNMKEDEFVMA